MAEFDPRWGDAIAHIESGGERDPYTSITNSGNGRRALGKYQVMEENLPEWSAAALGNPITTQQFLNSPDAQEMIFRHRFGSYVDKYGNPQDAASAWFTGRPLAQGAGASDRFGTTGAGYVDKFNSFLGDPSAGGSPAPAGQTTGQGAAPTAVPYSQQAPQQQATQAVTPPPLFQQAPAAPIYYAPRRIAQPYQSAQSFQSPYTFRG